MTLTLHHLALGAHDPERVAAFYRDVLSLAEVARHFDEVGALRSIWLELDNAVLMVERISEDAQRELVQTAAGLFLLALQVDAAERSAWENRLAAAGVPIEKSTDFTSYARDPEGNRVAISCYPLPASMAG